MDIISHIIFACILNFGSLNGWLILGSVLPDFDKFITYRKKQFKGYRSRTLFAELPFTSILIFLSVFINPSFTLGLISHYILDFISGETRPFYPFLKNVVDFNLKLKQKILVGVIIWLIGGILVIRQLMLS
ncbi:MAG: zinc dependent phospholipase C family protein [Candidatus Aenigmarchaeota archaeon]|nr:zinc dependent phospholipase C family protein [Candidatus Aenigmarchaeota archaeon]